MSKIHYATGGLITPGKSEFRTMCGRKFPTGGADIMRSGWGWKEYLTCEDCRHILTSQEYKKEYTYFRVRVGEGHYSQAFFMLKEAKNELTQMRKGYPKGAKTQTDLEYWKKVGKKSFIVKCKETEVFESI